MERNLGGGSSEPKPPPLTVPLVPRLTLAPISPATFHFAAGRYRSHLTLKSQKKNYNSKKEDLEEEDQGEDERNVIL